MLFHSATEYLELEDWVGGDFSIRISREHFDSNPWGDSETEEQICE